MAISADIVTPEAVRAAGQWSVPGAGVPLDDQTMRQFLIANRAELLRLANERFEPEMNRQTRGVHKDDFRWCLERGELRRHRWELIGPAVIYTAASLLHPRWMPAIGVVMVAAGIALFVRSRRTIPGHCRHCSYDLRATPPDKPCPECGKTSNPDDGKAVGA